MRGAITYAQSNEDKLYRQIKGAMALYGTTQSELANALGVSQGTYSHLLKNKAFSVHQLCLIADFYGLEVKLCDRH